MFHSLKSVEQIPPPLRSLQRVSFAGTRLDEDQCTGWVTVVVPIKDTVRTFPANLQAYSAQPFIFPSFVSDKYNFHFFLLFSFSNYCTCSEY